MFDRVLVKRLDAVKQSKGGIMLPESASKKVLEATVVAIGPGARNQVNFIIIVAYINYIILRIFNFLYFVIRMVNLFHWMLK